MKRILLTLIASSSISLMAMNKQKQIIPMSAPAYTQNDVNSMLKQVAIQKTAVRNHTRKPLALDTKPLALQPNKSEICFDCVIGCLGWPVALAIDLVCCPCDITGCHFNCGPAKGVSDKPVCCPLTQAACNGATCGNCCTEIQDHNPDYFATHYNY